MNQAIPLKSLDDVCSTLSDLEGVPISGDLAEWNLICAQGLSGSESLDVDGALMRLDEMAEHVDAEIRRNYHRFLSDPAQAEYSQTKFCVLMMVTVLQQDFGVRYNPDRIRDPDFRNSGDLFIHGLLNGNGGTCASMPVLYVAIGRRLGWPMKLAAARGHLFCRWDDPEGHHPFGKDRFNLEGTCQGAHLVDDDYFRRWPEFISDEMVERGGYLKSLTPEEEVALFLALRGHCLEDNRSVGKACEVYRWACRLAPGDPHYEAFFEHADFVRERLIEEQTHRDYFGPDVPLPFGYFPRHVLRQMSSDMMLAEHELHCRHRQAEQERREALERWEHRGMKWRLSSAPHQVVQIPFDTPNPGPPIPSFEMLSMVGSPSTTSGLESVAGHMTHTASALNHLNCTADELARLPARTLQGVSPHRLAARRQEAVAKSRSLPPGITIQQPRRPLLTPPNDDSRIQHESNLKED